MKHWESLIDQKIREAMEQGEFDDLPGKGKPVDTSENPFEDPEMRLAHRMLDANKDRIGHITTGSRQRGEEHWVYGRGGRRCRRCGTLILRADHGPGPASGPGADPEERITFWCPSCQPARTSTPHPLPHFSPI